MTLIVVFCAVLLVGTAALAIAGTADHRTTAFSVDVPPSAPVAKIRPGKTVCQAPVLISSPAVGISVWVPSGAGSATALLATVRSSTTNSPLARSELVPRAAGSGTAVSLAGRLTHELQPSQRITVCLTSASRVAVSLLGNVANASSGALTFGGRQKLALAMAFTAPRSRSLIALLPTVFARAALFHPGWMGAWTFWALLAGLVIAAGLVLRALLAAGSLDDDAEGSPAPEPDTSFTRDSPTG
jgi:hypothetical protein